jgi:hypothetical protein
MISQLDYMEKETRKTDRVRGSANNPLRKGVIGPESESYADLATKTREAIESYDLDWKQPGRTATLAELNGRPELNETTCQLLKFDRSAGRWQVRLPTGECIKVKPANMHPFRAKPKVMAFKGQGQGWGHFLPTFDSSLAFTPRRHGLRRDT